MKNKLLLISFFISSLLLAQVQNVPANADVYEFFKYLHVKGVIKSFNDFALPLSLNEVQSLINEALLNKNLLSGSENELLNKYAQSYINFYANDNHIFNNPDNLKDGSRLTLYKYIDSSINFQVFPNLEFKLFNDNNKTASFFLFGGAAQASYKNWAAFSISLANAALWGNRETAVKEKRIEQSYTFNKTKINFFDYTSGYIKLKNEIFSLQFGRERLLHGNSFYKRTLLSNNPPLFDFVKFDINYKKLNYSFIHNWLVSPVTIEKVDSFWFKKKQSKYNAISRLSFNDENFNLGFSQVIVYGDRPFEAAYLNPFLLWESAQRSLNDLDNSFWAFDVRYKPINGIQLSGFAMLDDINFGKYFKGDWNNVSNSATFHLSSVLTYPMFFKNSIFHFDYIIVRPFMYSHPGYNNLLTFTSNNYLLGENLHPNSLSVSAGITYYLNSKLTLKTNFEHIQHGRNVYDKENNLIKNVGGDEAFFYTDLNNNQAYFLDGDIEIKNKINASLLFEIKNDLFLDLYIDYDLKKDLNLVSLSFRTLLY